MYIHNIHLPRSYIDSHPSFISHMLLLYTTYTSLPTHAEESSGEGVRRPPGEDCGSQGQGQNVPFSHMGIQALAQIMMNRPPNFQKNNGDNVRGDDEEDYRQEIEVVLSPPNPAPTPDSMSVARRDPDVRSMKTAAKEAMTKFRSSKTKTKIVIIGGIICFLGAFSGGMGGIVAMKKSVAVDERVFVDVGDHVDLIDDCPSSAKSAKTCSCSTSEPSSAGKGGKSGSSGEPSSSAGKGGKSGSREPSSSAGKGGKSGSREPSSSAGKGDKTCSCSTSEPAGKGGKSGSREPSSSAGKGGKSGSREPSSSAGKGGKSGSREPSSSAGKGGKSGSVEPSSSAGKGGKSGSVEPSSSAGKGGKSGSREPTTGKSRKCKPTGSPTVSKICNCLAIDQMNCHLTTKLLVIKILAASDA